MFALFLGFWGFLCCHFGFMPSLSSNDAEFLSVSALELENERWVKSQEIKGNFPLLESGLGPQICCIR